MNKPQRVIWDERNGFHLTYDVYGVITSLYLFNAFTDDFTKVDPEHYERRHSTRYAYLQARVNEQLLLDEAFEAVEKGQDE